MAKEEVSSSDEADRRLHTHSSAECDSLAASTSTAIVPWQPRNLSFGSYFPREDAAAKPQDSRFAAKLPVSSCISVLLSALSIMVNLWVIRIVINSLMDIDVANAYSFSLHVRY